MSDLTNQPQQQNVTLDEQSKPSLANPGLNNQTKEQVADEQAVISSVADCETSTCPVCQTTFIYNQITLCTTCGWSLQDFICIAENESEISHRELLKLSWAKQVWSWSQRQAEIIQTNQQYWYNVSTQTAQLIIQEKEQLRNEFASRIERIEQNTRDELRGLQEELASTNSQLEQCEKKLRETQVELDKSNSTCTSFQKQLDAYVSSNQKLSNQVADVQQQLSESRVESCRMEKKISNLEEASQSINSQVNALGEQTAKVQESLSKNEENVEQLNSQVEAVAFSTNENKFENFSNNSLDEVDYTRLQKFLAEAQWKDADQETTRIILYLGGDQAKGYVCETDIDNISQCSLQNIDRLWMKYSGSRFGFSVQAQIYQGSEDYEDFCTKVGWIEVSHQSNVFNKEAIHTSFPYDEFKFNSLAPVGHLPSLSGGWRFYRCTRTRTHHEKLPDQIIKHFNNYYTYYKEFLRRCDDDFSGWCVDYTEEAITKRWVKNEGYINTDTLLLTIFNKLSPVSITEFVSEIQLNERPICVPEKVFFIVGRVTGYSYTRDGELEIIRIENAIKAVGGVIVDVVTKETDYIVLPNDLYCCRSAIEELNDVKASMFPTAERLNIPYISALELTNSLPSCEES